jgi:hypothetical protein
MKGRWQKIGADKIGNNFGDYTRKHSTVALGATTRRYYHQTISSWSMKMEHTIFEPILEKNNYSTIASGVTPIGSAGRAPDDVYSWIPEQGRWRKIQWNVITPIGSELFIKLWLYNPNILYVGSVKQGCDIWLSSCVIAIKLECRDLSRR